MSAETNQEQCHAITAGGDRCGRPAGEDGFCYQHDESDGTVDAYDEMVADGGDDETENGDDESDESEAASDETQDARGADQAPEEGEEVGREEVERSDAPTDVDDVRDVRETVQSLAPDIIGRELDAVIEVDSRDSGWLAVVEVVERPAVPDTQDILGRYEIDIEDGSVTGYRRTDRYRRSDTDAGEVR